ncbi:MAG: sulfatase [Thermoanaerobaculia bacterium]
MPVGLAAGVVVFLVDDVLAWSTLGYSLPPRLHFVLAYAAAGLLGALLLGAGWRVLRHRRLEWSEWLAVTVAAAYVPAVAERAFTALHFRTGDAVATLGLVVAIGGYGLWIALLARIAGYTAGPWIGAVAVAVALALNRNVIALPTEPLALVADAATVASALAAALAARKLGARRVAMAAAAVAVLVVAVRALPEWLPSPSREAQPVDAGESPTTAAATAGSPPNVLLVIIDTLRADVFEAVVAETEEGRAFRRALGAAVTFNNATAAAPWTPPSVGSIMTGLYPQEHGFDRVKGNAPGRPLRKLDESLTTIAEHLRAHGYQTAAIATNPFLNHESGIMQGFERFETLEEGTAKLPLMTALQRAGLVKTELYQDAVRVHRRLARLTALLAGDERPFFLWLHLMDPHKPLRPHRDLSADPSAAKLPSTDRLYRDEVRFALRELARMFELLQKRGLWEPTAVVVVADHGEMMISDRRFEGRRQRGKHFRRRGHGHALFDELVRVPLVIRPATDSVDRQVEVLTSHVDLAHTVADLAGVERMRLPDLRVSLRPWLGDESAAERPAARTTALVGSMHFGVPDQRGLRTRRFKLIEYTDGKHPAELYDLSRDAGERRSLAGKNPRRLARLRELLEQEWGRMAPAPQAEELEIDDEARERLKALGYL